jgi:hypothetical protein
MGFSSLRVDLAGKGDSPPRPGLTDQQSVAADYDEILRVLESRLAHVSLILAGLCSGADNAIRLAPKDSRVVGLVLLDPVCSPDDGFSARAFVLKYTNTARYVARLKRCFEAPTTQPRGSQEQIDPLTLRDAPTLEQLRDAPTLEQLRGAPTLEQLRSAFESIRERDGRVLSVFTQYALQYYNQAGQLGRVLGVDGYQQFCTELFLPQAEHTYTLDLHRRRLIEEIKNWAGGYIRP